MAEVVFGQCGAARQVELILIGELRKQRQDVFLYWVSRLLPFSTILQEVFPQLPDIVR